MHFYQINHIVVISLYIHFLEWSFDVATVSQTIAQQFDLIIMISHQKEKKRRGTVGNTREYEGRKQLMSEQCSKYPIIVHVVCNERRIPAKQNVMLAKNFSRFPKILEATLIFRSINNHIKNYS